LLSELSAFGYQLKRLNNKNYQTSITNIIIQNYFTTGNEAILNLAAPIGINSTVSSFVATVTGLCGNKSHNPYLSNVHSGIILPVAFKTIGVAPGVNG